MIEIDPQLETQAFDEARARFPQFAAREARLVARPLFRGEAWMLQWADPPDKTDVEAWEFQNAVIRAYKRLKGISP